MWSWHFGQRKIFVTMAWPEDTASHFLQVIWSQSPHVWHIPCCGLSASAAGVWPQFGHWIIGRVVERLMGITGVRKTDYRVRAR